MPLPPGGRISVLVHGCFWHRCPAHFHAPKANAEWWRLKLESVGARDADTMVKLAAAGWLPVVVWEHEPAADAAARLQALHHERRLAGIGRAPVSVRRPPISVPEDHGPVFR